jgi:hypothetical protein
MLDRAQYREVVIDILSRHVGPDNPVTMYAIFTEALNTPVIPNKKVDQTRPLRSIIKQLRREGYAIAYNNHGYYLATAEEHIEHTAAVFHKRALASLSQERSLKRCTTRDLLQQYELELEIAP